MTAADPATTTADSGPPCPNCGQPTRPGVRFCRNCGAALTDDQAPPVEPGPVPAAGARLSWAGLLARLRGLVGGVGDLLRRMPRRRRRLLGAAAALILVFVCGGYYVVQHTWYTPDEPVRRLFAALAAKDGAAVAELGGCGPVCSTGGMAQGYEPPTDLHVLGVNYRGATVDDPTRRPDHSRAGVKVRYRVGDTTYEDIVGVSRPNRGWLRPWAISGAPGGYVQLLSTGLATAKIAGATVETGSPDRSTPRASAGRYFLPPGVYTVAGAQSALWSVDPVRVVVAGDLNRYAQHAGQRVALELAVKPAVVDEVRQQIRQRIDACAAIPAFKPRTDRGRILSDCPFSASEDHTITQGLKWTIVDYPRIELRLGNDQAVTVRTTTPGHARLDYQYSRDVIEPRTWTSTSQTVEITPDGSVAEDNGRVAWSG